MSFTGLGAHNLVRELAVLAVSAGSACSSADTEPSAVLKALGVPDDLAAASLRIGLGRFTTREEVDFAAERIISTVRRLRG